jgi:hypothetical protein
MDNLKVRSEQYFENEMIINSTKSKTLCFKETRVMEPLNYSLRDIVVPEARNRKYLEIMLHSDLSCVVQVNYTVEEALKALHFTIRILKNERSNTRRLAYTSLMRLILNI